MIKNLILDFGDIFINLDKQATPRELAKLGSTSPSTELISLCMEYEKGNCTSSQFLRDMAGHFPNVSEKALTKAWNAILLDFPLYRLEFLEKMANHRTYRLFLLSNTNDIHITHVKRRMGKAKYLRFKNAFEHFYLSYEMGMRKPDLEIFEFVLEKHQLIPEETLFVDDTKENTDAAAKTGIKVWNLLVGQEDIIELKTRLQ